MLTGGAQYEFYERRFDVYMTLGYTPDDSYPSGIFQVNFGFHWSPFINKNYFWPGFSPLEMGLYVILIHPDDEGLFIESPGHYPNPDYYDPTALRYATYLGASQELPAFLEFQRVTLKGWLSATERQLVARFNSPEYIKPWHFLSFGIGLNLVF